MSIIKETMINLASGNKIGSHDELTFGYTRNNRSQMLHEVIEYFESLGETSIVSHLKTITSYDSTLSQLITAYRSLKTELAAKYSGKQLEAVYLFIGYAVAIKASSVMRVIDTYVDTNIKKNHLIEVMLKSLYREYDLSISNKDKYHEALDVLEVIRFLTDYTYSVPQDTRELITSCLTKDAEKVLATGNIEYSGLRYTSPDFINFTGDFREPIKRILIAMVDNNLTEASVALKDFENAVRPSTSYSILDEVIFDSGIFQTIS